jgi:pyridoxamine 5'-phosphate oxidase
MSRANDTYIARQAPDYFGAVDPFALFDTWFAEAKAHEPNDPNAMSVATVDSTGMPNVRIVLLKGLDDAAHGSDRGFVFYTNHEGAKGRELLATRKAALNFHWKSLNRQVRIRGSVYATRARGSRIGAWASQQSRSLSDRAELERAVAAFEKKFGEGDIPRPAYWSGFRVTPLSIEFWHDRPFRLHDRLVFGRTATGDAWAKTRLSP